MCPGFDAAAAVREAQQRRAEDEERQAAAGAAYRAWNEACAAARKDFTESKIQTLVELYRQRGYGFWLDYQECLQVQQQVFFERCGITPNRELQACWAFTLRLMKSALLPETSHRVPEILQEIEQLNIRPQVCSELATFQEEFHDWMSHFPPSTPLLRRTDLAEACKLGHMNGYYPMARITERIQNHTLQVFGEQFPKTGRKSAYASFCDTDSESQRQILRCVVMWVRTKMKSEDSFSGGLWITESAT